MLDSLPSKLCRIDKESFIFFRVLHHHRVHALPVIKAVSYVGANQLKAISNQTEFQKHYDNEKLDRKTLCKYDEYASRKSADVMVTHALLNTRIRFWKEFYIYVPSNY